MIVGPRIIVMLGGLPASGKSTIARALLSRLGPRNAFVSGLVRGSYASARRVVVLGEYDSADERFAGTDRLSMAVQPAARAWLASVEAAGVGVFFEGDRLFNGAMIEACLLAGWPTRLMLVTATSETLRARHAGRGDTQGESWLRGRETKVCRLRERYPLEILENETPDDVERHAAYIAGLLEARR